MAKYASKVVSQAKSWLGCKESNGTHKKIIDLYNTQKKLPRGYKVKYTDEWCATFVSAVAVKLGYTDIIPTECGCPKMIELFKKLGRWKEDESVTPKAGYIIFYDWEDNGKGDNTGTANHVGIVEKVSGSTITVIEGNYNESVARRTIKVNGKYIRGYGVPKYDSEPKATAIETNKKSIDTIAKEILKGKWGNGTARTKKLKAAGYTSTEIKKIQAKVNELSKSKKTTVKKDLKTVAKQVYSGKYGNGTARTKKLKAAGYTSAEIKEIQKLVNKMC